MQVGHCGNKVGQKFWELVSKEHCLDSDGQYAGVCSIPRQRIDVYYDLASDETYIPRSVFVDLEPGTLHSLQRSCYGKLFNRHNFILGKSGAANNWAKGFYGEGAELLDGIMELTRKHANECDSLQGFQMVHSIGGGTGSGLGSLMLRKLQDDYGSKIINTFSIVPSPKVSEVVVEPYNAVLSLNELIESSHETVCLDNDALHNIAGKYVDAECPKYEDLNHLIAMAMSGITTCFRFPGQLNTNLRKLKVNMVLFPRLHFFFPAVAPIPPSPQKGERPVNISDMTQQLFNPDFHMVQCNSNAGTYLTSATIFRGPFATRDIEETMVRMQDAKDIKFATWIPNNIKTAICNVPPAGMTAGATFLANSTAITVMLKRIHGQYTAMLEKGAYLHWYQTEGMEEAEFEAAKNNVAGLIDAYQEYHVASDHGSSMSTAAEQIN